MLTVFIEESLFLPTHKYVSISVPAIPHSLKNVCIPSENLFVYKVKVRTPRCHVDSSAFIQLSCKQIAAFLTEC